MEQVLCQGNCDADFIELVSSYISKPSPTVHHTECEMLCSEGSHWCWSCKKYCSTLRSQRSKAAKAKKHCEQRTAHDSHTNLYHLVDGELIQRLQNVQKAKKNCHKKQGMRWHPPIVCFVLNLKYLSSSTKLLAASFPTLQTHITNHRSSILVENYPLLYFHLIHW